MLKDSEQPVGKAPKGFFKFKRPDDNETIDF